MDCPTCNGTHTKVIETHRCTNGTRRRRYRCFDCEHRWSIWDGDRPPKGGIGPRRRPIGKRAGRLTPDQIRLALTRADLNNKQASQLLNCSAETVRQIRCGMIYGSIFPNLIRPKAIAQKPASDGPNCLDCQQWSDGRCSFGFPDPQLEGLTFAADCSTFTPRDG